MQNQYRGTIARLLLLTVQNQFRGTIESLQLLAVQNLNRLKRDN